MATFLDWFITCLLVSFTSFCLGYVRATARCRKRLRQLADAEVSAALYRSVDNGALIAHADEQERKYQQSIHDEIALHWQHVNVGPRPKENER